MNPRAAINDLLPFQGSPFSLLGISPYRFKREQMILWLCLLVLSTGFFHFFTFPNSTSRIRDSFSNSHEQRMCLGTFSRLRRSLATSTSSAAVRILAERILLYRKAISCKVKKRYIVAFLHLHTAFQLHNVLFSYMPSKSI